MNQLTSRRVCRHAWVLAAVVVLPTLAAGQAVTVAPQGPVLQGQPPRDRVPPPQRAGTAVLKGRVVDGAGSTPVPRARVRLVGGPGVSKGPVLTDAEGTFEFTALPAGNYSVQVEKSSYLPGRYPEMGRSIRARGQPLVLRDGQVVDNFTIPLFHGAAIAGRVFDAYGDPVDQAQVRAVRISRGGRPTTVGQWQTNDLGEYRIPRLQPGRYLVQVQPQMNQNYAPDPSVVEMPLPQPFPTYYPNAVAMSQAQAITVNRGETMTGIDLTLAEGTPTLVTGTVVRSDGQPVVNGSISSRVVGAEASYGFFGGGGTGIRPGGTFRLPLAPGEYALEARVVTRQGPGPTGPNDQLVGTARVSVGGGGVEDVTITVGGGATATGRVIFEGTTPPPPSPGTVGVPFFNPDGPGCRSGQATIAADWTFKIEGISGICGAPPQGMFGRWTLKAVTFRGQNLTNELVTFENGQHYTNVQVVVTDKRTQMDLHVSGDDGQPTREYVALAFPIDKAKWDPRFRPVRTYTPPPPMASQGTSRTPPQGVAASATVTPIGPGGFGAMNGMMMSQQERIAGLSPGEYYVIAIDDIEVEDSQDPAILERLTSSAIRVVLTDDAPIEVPLRRVSLADVVR